MAALAVDSVPNSWTMSTTPGPIRRTLGVIGLLSNLLVFALRNRQVHRLYSVTEVCETKLIRDTLLTRAPRTAASTS